MRKNSFRSFGVWLTTLALGFGVFLSAGLLTPAFVRATEINVNDLVDFVVEVEEGRDIRVLQLTDTQIINSDDKRYNSVLGTTQTNLYNSQAIAYNYENTITNVINEYDPDFIIMTGDQVYGKFDDSGANHQAMIDFMDSFKIPWAPIFGNHEIESNIGADAMCRQYEESDYCLFKQNTITGNGNYTVGLTQGGTLKRVFFMMDSNGTYQSSQASVNNGQTKTSWGFAEDQKDWYTTVGKAINKAVPDAKISFAFHVPFKAVYDALEVYGYSQSHDFANDPIFIDEHPDKEETDFGFIASAGGDAWDTDYAYFNAMKDIGVDSIFVGHIHTVSASVVKDGIRFQFGLKTGLYDTRLTKIGDKFDATHAVGGKPYVGGSAIVLSETDGSIQKAYHIYDDIESDAGNGTESTLGEPVLDGSFKGYAYSEYQLNDIVGELSSSDKTEYYDVTGDSYSLKYELAPTTDKFSLSFRLLSNGTSSSGYPVTITNSGVSIVNETPDNGNFSMDFLKGKTYEIEVGAVKVYDGNTYYLFVKVDGVVGAKWRYEEASAYTLGSKLGVKYSVVESEQESLMIDMGSLLRNPNRVQANGFNTDGSYYSSWALTPQATKTDTGVDYTISSHTNGEFYYNGLAEGFSLNFTATQASDPWETGTYNSQANNDILFVILRSDSNGAPWNGTQGYIFMFQRTMNGTKTATKCNVYAKVNGSGWDANLVGTADWFDGDLFDGKTRKLEVSAVNNEENTAVTLKMAVNGTNYFNEVYNQTPLSMENTGFRITDYVAGGTGTEILYKFTDSVEIDVDYKTGTQLVNSGKLVTDYKANVPVTIKDGWAYSENSWLVYNGEITAVDFDIIITNTADGPSEIALYMRANGSGTLWDNSQGYIAWIKGTSVTISKTLQKYTDGHTDLVSGTVANIFDGEAHNIKFYAVNASDGKVYGGISIDGGDMITFVDGENTLSLTGTNFKIVGVNVPTPRYKIGKYVPHTHDYSENWSYDEKEHWNECSCGDKINAGEHFDMDDHNCDVCLKVLTSCFDDDGDYSCDICGEAVGTPPSSSEDSSSVEDSSSEDVSSSEEESSSEDVSSSEEESSFEDVSSSEEESSSEDVSSSEEESSSEDVSNSEEESSSEDVFSSEEESSAEDVSSSEEESSSEEVSNSESDNTSNDEVSSEETISSENSSNIEESGEQSTESSSEKKSGGCGSTTSGLMMVMALACVSAAFIKGKRKAE